MYLWYVSEFGFLGVFMGGNIFWNLHEIPIPADAKRNAYDNQVSKYYKDGNGRRRRVVIGRAVTETTMHPNQNFRYYYPELWKLYYLEDVTAQHEIHFGLYALLLGAGYRSGICSAQSMPMPSWTTLCTVLTGIALQLSSSKTPYVSKCTFLVDCWTITGSLPFSTTSFLKTSSMISRCSGCSAVPNVIKLRSGCA